MRTAVAIASGPSLTQQDVDYCRHKKATVATVNTSFRLAPWADIHYSNDHDWYQTYIEELIKNPARKICGHPDYRHPAVETIAYDRDLIGINLESDFLCWNANSGGALIDLLAKLGHEKIILLGFDFSWDGDKSHHHGDHPKHLQHRKPGFHRWVPYFKRIHEDSIALGIDVVNCTRRTELPFFRRAELEAEL